MGNRQPKRMHQWRYDTQVDCFLPVPLPRPLQNPHSEQPGQALVCLNGCCVSLLSPGQQDAESVNIRLRSVDFF
jgi:hypothetical protein